MDYIYLSNSALGTFLYSPRKWYEKYVEKKEEDKDTTEAQILGSLVHCLLLRPLEVNDHFVVSDVKLPSLRVAKVVKGIFKNHKDGDLKDYALEILDICKELNYNQHLKEDDKRIAAVLKDGNSYFDYLKKIGNKTLVSQDMYDYALSATNTIKANNDIKNALGIDTNLEVHAEEEIRIESSKYQYFGLKGILDHYLIDHNNRKIYLNDLKCMMSKKLVDFPESVEYWQYNRQLAFYVVLLVKKYPELIDAGYTIDSSFIVIDKDLDVYKFGVKEDTMLSWIASLSNTLTEIEYHFKNEKFNLPWQFELNTVVL